MPSQGVLLDAAQAAFIHLGEATQRHVSECSLSPCSGRPRYRIDGSRAQERLRPPEPTNPWNLNVLTSGNGTWWRRSGHRPCWAPSIIIMSPMIVAGSGPTRCVDGWCSLALRGLAAGAF